MTDARTPQFELYAELKQRGVKVAVEVPIAATSAKSRGKWFYADVAVFLGNRIVALAECKSRVRELRGRQRENYDGCGIPWRVCGAENVQDVALWMEAHAG